MGLRSSMYLIALRKIMMAMVFRIRFVLMIMPPKQRYSIIAKGRLLNCCCLKKLNIKMVVIIVHTKLKK